MLFQSRGNIVVSNVRCLKLKGLAGMISPLNAFGGDAHVRLRRMGVRMPLNMHHIRLALTVHSMRLMTPCPYK